MKKQLQQKKHRLLVTIVLLMIALITMAVTLYSFSCKINVHQAELGKERLEEVTTQNIAFINLMVENKIQFVDSVAKNMAEFEDLRSEEALDLLGKFACREDFERLALDFFSGVSYTSDGHIVDISDMNYIEQARDKKTFITEVKKAKMDGEPCISIISPIIRNGVVQGAVRGTIYTENFGKMINSDFFDGEGYFHLLDSKGEYLAVPETVNALLMDENYFDAIDQLVYDENYNAQQIRDDIANGLSGSTAYSYEGMGRYVEYMPVGINDWYLMVIAPKWVIDQNAQNIQREVILLVVQLFVILLVVFLFIIYTMKNSRDEIKKINEKLLVGEKRYRFMLERSDNIIFEYTLNTAVIEYSEKFAEVFGYEPTSAGLPLSVIKSGGIHPDDAQSLLGLFEDVKSGKSGSTAELRIRNGDGHYIWCSIVVAAILGQDNSTVKVLGVIENIDVKKRKEMALITKAEKDQLTDLYNKITTEQLIRNFLSCNENHNGKHALMIIDVDDFKRINDTLGHLYGDVVLTNLANCLKSLFREYDIVGRIGGDEFFVFLKNINAEDDAENKAKEICTLFRKTYSEDSVNCAISASVGIAVFPYHGEDFETLYKNADSALYNTKAGGKDSYSIYSGGVTSSYTSRRTDMVSRGISEQKSFRENKIEYIFRMLYATKDPVSAVHTALRLLVDYFNFSSSYVFEQSADGTMLTNTFGWSTGPNSSISQRFKHIEISQFAAIYEVLEKENLFIMQSLDEITATEREILESVDIKSMFLFAIRQDETLVGFIGFDDCVRERFPTSTEIDEMVIVCNVLSTFLLKQRALECAQNNNFTLSEILNNMEYYCYVISKDTYELLFVNEKIRRNFRMVVSGKRCYETFMNRSAPCVHCPVAGLSAKQTSHTVKVNNEMYDVYSKTTASWINWIDGREACLISSVDISDCEPICSP